MLNVFSKMNEIEIRGPSALGSASKQQDDRPHISPPIVKLSNPLAMTTHLGLMKARLELEKKLASNSSEDQLEKSAKGHLRSARLLPLGFVPINRKSKSTNFSITSAKFLKDDKKITRSTRPQSCSNPPRIDYEVMERDLYPRSYSACINSRRGKSISISKDNGVVTVAKPTLNEETSEPSTQATSEPSEPYPQSEDLESATPKKEQSQGKVQREKKLSSSIPYKHPGIDTTHSFHVRSYSSPGERTNSIMMMQEPMDGASLLPHMPNERHQTIASNMKILQVQAPLRRKMASLRQNQIKFSQAHGADSTRYGRTGMESGPAPTSKLYPLRGRVNTQQIDVLKGSRMKVATVDRSQSEEPDLVEVWRPTTPEDMRPASIEPLAEKGTQGEAEKSKRKSPPSLTVTINCST